MKNKIFAIPAAPAAMLPKPNIAAIMATMRKITVQRNIVLNFVVIKLFSACRSKTVPHLFCPAAIPAHLIASSLR